MISHLPTALPTPPVGLGRLGYGAANVGNLYREVSDEAAWNVLDAAWDSGVRHFDTAPHYGLGLSERRLGAFLRTKRRSEYLVSTKVGRLLRPNPDGAGTLDLAHDFAVPSDLRRIWDFSSSGIRQSLVESLERLGLDAVDVIYLHDPEEFDLDVAIREGIPAAAGLRDEGVVTAVGVGSKSTDALIASARTAALDLVMIAGRYTLVEQPAASELLPLCGELGVGAVCAAVFNSGLLAKPRPSGSSRYEYGAVPAPLLERAARIADVCESFGIDLPTAALHFPFRNSAVVSVVVGGASAEQVRQNAARMAVEPPAELWAALAHNDLVTT